MTGIWAINISTSTALLTKSSSGARALILGLCTRIMAVVMAVVPVLLLFVLVLAVAVAVTAFKASTYCHCAVDARGGPAHSRPPIVPPRLVRARQRHCIRTCTTSSAA